MRKVALQIDDAGLLDRIATILAGEAGIGTLHPGAPDVMITDHLPFSVNVPTILLSDSLSGPEALKAGGSGILPRDVAIADLLLALEAVDRGFVIMPRGAAGIIRNPAAHDPSDLPRDDLLTARRLGISFHTAKFHVASIAAKLDATGRTDAVAQAIGLGLIML